MNADQKNAALEAHMRSLVETPREPVYLSNTHWELAKPTYIENWPDELHQISIPSAIRRLTIEEARILGSFIYELGEAFDVSDIPESLKESTHVELVGWMDEKIKQFPQGAFVRLGSRSPKDSMYWGCDPNDQDSGRVSSGEEAFRRLVACSERVYQDLQLAIAQNYQPTIVLRPWVDMPQWSEFRCFQKAGELTGISQYYHREFHPEVATNHSGIVWAIQKFHERLFVPACHLQDVVFDVFVKRSASDNVRRYEVKLLEINPYWDLTDPCLFNWNKPEEFDGRFKYREKKLWEK